MINFCIVTYLAMVSSFSVGKTPGVDEIQILNNCVNYVPHEAYIYADLYYEFYDLENISTAVKITYCESRFNKRAYRKEDRDSGLKQFIPSTWNWIAEMNDLPKFDEYVILRHGRPYTKQEVSKTDYGFKQIKAQYSAYYNLLFGSILAEDTYSNTTWRDWNSSKDCWGDDNTFYEIYRKENGL